MSARPAVALRDVSFRFDAAPRELLSGVTLDCPAGFTGVVGANGAGKTTLLRLLAGELRPDTGRVEGADGALRCDQRTDTPPPDLDELLVAPDANGGRLRARLAVPRDAPWRWDALSHGERKRCQLAVALWRDPPLLALDEPTNHVDADTRDLLIAALRDYRGVGVLVSHDRELLDALCVQCLWLDPPDARTYPGDYSTARALREAGHASALAERDNARRRRDALEREDRRRRRAAAEADGRRSKRGLAAGDADGRERIDRARVTGKDGAAGRRLRQMQGHLDRARAAVDAAHVREAGDLGIDIETRPARRDALLDLPAGTLALHEALDLEHPDLRLGPRDRLAISGPNGAGKSRLLEALRPRLRVDPERLLWMPQEIAPQAAADLLAELDALPSDALGRVLQIVAHLGSDPARVRESRAPSPGELRKLWLARALARGVELVVLDEPTNHLDLPSVECLEAALAAADCALVLVSHDTRFLDGLVDRQWRLARGDAGRATLAVGDEPPVSGGRG
jgi:ATPase subunit of ABC transporter with duplicated ATPase domains